MKAPKAMERPASCVSMAVHSTTKRVNAAKISGSRTCATGQNTWRRAIRPMPRMAITATVTLRAANPSAASTEPSPLASATTQTRNGATERSWTISTAKAERPKRDVISPRSDSSCRTIAVEDSASPPPITTAAVMLAPASSARPAITTEVTMTCAAPSPKIRPRMTLMRSSGSSNPTVNKRNTTPSSASARVVSTSVIRARPVGPITAPATR